MPDIFRKIIILFVTTLVIWFGVAMVDAVIGGDMTETVVILAFLGSMGLWMVFGLAQIGIITQEEISTRQKAKRASTNNSDDPRLALMLALMTPDERDALKARLADELQADGEALPLADLLTEQSHVADRSR